MIEIVERKRNAGSDLPPKVLETFGIYRLRGTGSVDAVPSMD